MSYTRNQHNTADQLYFHKNKIEDIVFELKKNFTYQIFLGHETKIKLDYLNHDLFSHASHLFSSYKDISFIRLRAHFTC